MKGVFQIFHHCIFFTVVTGGLIGNTLLCCVTRHKQLRNKPYGVLLLTLAIFDSCNIAFITWNKLTKDFDVFLPKADWQCKVTEYLSHVVMYISAWILVLISVERVLVLTKPHRARVSCCNMTRIIISLFSIVLLSVLLPLYRLFFVKLNKKKSKCVFGEESLGESVSAEVLLHLCIVFIIPSVFICICNIVCIVKANQYYRQYACRPTAGIGGGGAAATDSGPAGAHEMTFTTSRHQHQQQSHHQENLQRRFLRAKRSTRRGYEAGMASEQSGATAMITEKYGKCISSVTCNYDGLQKKSSEMATSSFDGSSSIVSSSRSAALHVSHPTQMFYRSRRRATHILLIISFVYVICHFLMAVSEFMVFRIYSEQMRHKVMNDITMSPSPVVVSNVKKNPFVSTLKSLSQLNSSGRKDLQKLFYINRWYLQPIGTLTMCISYGANFYIYLLMGKAFRNNTWLFIRKGCGGIPRLIQRFCYFLRNAFVQCFSVCGRGKCWCRGHCCRRNSRETGCSTRAAWEHQPTTTAATAAPTMGCYSMPWTTMNYTTGERAFRPEYACCIGKYDAQGNLKMKIVSPTSSAWKRKRNTPIKTCQPTLLVNDIDNMEIPQ